MAKEGSTAAEAPESSRDFSAARLGEVTTCYLETPSPCKGKERFG
jgi:hypothetical protein